MNLNKTKSKHGFGVGHIPWNKGKQFSATSKEKMSKARLGKTPWNKGMKGWKSNEALKVWRENGGQVWLKGKKMDEATKKKLSEAHKKAFAEGKVHPFLGKKHSEETKRKWSELRKGKPNPHQGHCGEKNSNWKGGATTISRMVRTMPEYYKWRQAVFERDRFICQICGQLRGEINADHIVPFSVILRTEGIRTIRDARDCEFLWDVSNGRTLCVKCHKDSPSAQHRELIMVKARLEAELRTYA